nr:reversion-inducing cysteine-rich protein with Kazal motifs-like [Dermatophagoides farinae]
MCQNSCHNSFNEFCNDDYYCSDKSKILDQIEISCDKPLVNLETDELWDCLLTSGYFNGDNDLNDGHKNIESISNEKSMKKLQINTVDKSYYGGMNPAKFVCCERAQQKKCRKLCYETYSNKWLESWQNFEQFCQRSSNEISLNQCLDDADSLCTYKCPIKLHFCHHFNNFEYPLRNCNRNSDKQAEKMFHLWILQNMTGLVTNVSNQNQMEMWKNLACLLHIRPCMPQNHDPMPICQSNCVELFHHNSLNNQIEMLDKNIVCDFLDNTIHRLTKGSSDLLFSRENPEKCLNLNRMTIKSDNRISTYSVTSRMNEEECFCQNDHQQCSINHDCFINDCPRIRCSNICSIGKLSELKISLDTSIKLPMIQSFDNNNNHLNNCYHQCYCNPMGTLVDCYYHCFSNTSINEKQEWIKLIQDQLFCMSQCSDTYEPICSFKTGHTYLNKCFYECFHNESEFEMEYMFGRNCRRIGDDFKKICLKNKNKESCIMDDSVQLFEIKEMRISIERLQYICDDFNQSEVEWMNLNDMTVCDTKGQEHLNICTLQNFTTSYFGKCRVYCSMSGPVCGRDLYIYYSECAAQAANVFVDYFDSCGSNNKIQEKFCPTITSCPEQYIHWLPFNQCPFCGSVAYFIYDRNYFKKISYQSDALTIQYLLLRQKSLNIKTLSRQIQSLMDNNDCQLSIHLLAPGFVTVLIRSKFESNYQNDVCHKELLRLIIIIKNRSPIVQLKFPLSLLYYDETINEKIRLWSSMLAVKQQQQWRKLKFSNINSGIMNSSNVSYTFIFLNLILLILLYWKNIQVS